MARRRRIEAPSAEELARLDAESDAGFAAKPSLPPIAQVAAETAARVSPLDEAAQAEQARDRTDAEALRRARAEGWEVRALPMAEVHTDAMPRDRLTLDAEAMEELRASLRSSGLRLPIEVSERREGGFDLISGFRRLTAMREVAGPEGTIRAFVRPAPEAADALAAMVEENEIRSDVSSYERGRTAAMAVQDGVFPDLATAVDRLFAAASKAKRSKVRSFALIHEELGDLLSWPGALSERQGLRLAGALKAGQGAWLRQALGTGAGTDPAEEWVVMEEALDTLEAERDRPVSQRNRPRETQTGRAPRPGRIDLANGMSITHEVDSRGHVLRFGGKVVDTTLVRTVMDEIERLLRAE
ncbi:ParB/RepB/Spo0J family partition protein [Jannaschia rubra]|uniref:ParB/RepB/Spo0J family partition protein n=1 Tax=Jannaschia rubra TaxID=282197 RepID=UPI002492DEBF|nr:ParB N-terminal domain-containing protein [Jannaschia rubra]